MTTRRFLLLQGPHGPFFHRLGRILRRSGAAVTRVGFNPGDRAFWPEAETYRPFHGSPAEWPAACADLLDGDGITDLVLYGDTRPLHAAALSLAGERRITVHVFEEGYLRPYWTTYERGGSNARSRLALRPVREMAEAAQGAVSDQRDVPARWGELRHHMLYGALYHAAILAGRMARPEAYAGWESHRDVSVEAEMRLHLRRGLRLPALALHRRVARARLDRAASPYHLLLLQLDHDASFRAHSPFASTADVMARVLPAFAGSAPRHHHLVLKAHPLEDDRVPLGPAARRLTRMHGLEGRVHLLRGGKLAPLLNEARSVVTVNSTAAQQALWRGLPVKALGDGVYCKPELVSGQTLEAFFADPQAGDLERYREYRQYLLETCQVPGSFYSARGRRLLLRRVVDMMLDPLDPYDRLEASKRPGNTEAPAALAKLKSISR